MSLSALAQRLSPAGRKSADAIIADFDQDEVPAREFYANRLALGMLRRVG